MLNTTILFLSLSSISNSPSLLISNMKERSHLSIYSSVLTKHTQTFLHVITVNHRTEIKNTIIQQFISTPLVFISAENANCYIGDDQNWENKPIKNKKLTNDHFNNNGDHHRPFFVSNCGDLTIAGCNFINLASHNFGSHSGGGALLVEQNCIVTIHECLFSNCQSNMHGGAILICKERKFSNVQYPVVDKDDVAFHDDEIPQLTTQFCCFQDCYIFSEVKDGKVNQKHGAAMYVAASTTNISFLSTVRCPGHDRCRHRGAQFDIQSDTKIDSSNINTTGGYSRYCAGIEYRHSNSGSFKFQTVTNMIGKFITSLTSLKVAVDVSYCNYVNNTVVFYTDGGDGDDSALIHVRFEATRIVNFCFVQTAFEGTDNKCKLVASDVNHPGIAIVVNCFSDITDKSRFNAKTIDNLQVFEEGKATTCTFQQLDLGDCQGAKTADQIIISQTFTPSSYFSNSSPFSSSDGFSNSNPFTPLDSFSNSMKFSSSDAFSASEAPPKDRGADLGGGKDKLGTGPMVGIIVGCVAAAAIIAALVAFFIIKKRNSLPFENDVDGVNDQETAVTTDNTLRNLMTKDDPFDHEFEVNNPADL